MYLGVDVGTGSVRAGLFSGVGECLRTAVVPITVYNSQPDYYEQSSEEIWQACLKAMKNAVAGSDPNQVRSIGFDATTSLVILDKNFEPLAINSSGINERNIIMWLDHRAVKQAEEINKHPHKVLNACGGKVFVEMQTPKLKWLKETLPDIWSRIGYCFELSDFLTWKATGSDSRSSGCLVQKWTYEMEDDGKGSWDRSYFHQIGLAELVDEEYPKIGSSVLMPGTKVKGSINRSLAENVGLRCDVAVGSSIIDAFAGAVGVLGCNIKGSEDSITNKMVLVSGTSFCYMAVSRKSVFVKGVWGPYRGIIPGYSFAEGGQGVGGKLIDFIIDTHPATSSIKHKLPPKQSIYDYLECLLDKMVEECKLKHLDFLTHDFHMYPDFHGNRSPLADPTLKGMVCGLTLDSSEENLALLYLVTVQALAYGGRHTIRHLNDNGINVNILVICGGLRQSRLFIQTHANVLGMRVLIPLESESVLLGSAILGAVAVGDFTDIESAMKVMAGSGDVVHPEHKVKSYHNSKYQVFLKMLEDQKDYTRIMKDCC